MAFFKVARTGPQEYYLREWASAMVAAAYNGYGPEADTLMMTKKQEFVLADQESPLFADGAL